MEVTTGQLKSDLELILEAIARNETLTLTHEGIPVASISPISESQRMRAADHPAFGMWEDREDMTDPEAFVRILRQGRIHDL